MQSIISLFGRFPLLSGWPTAALVTLSWATFCYGQQAGYRGMGSVCNGPGFSANKLGEFLMIDQTTANKTIVAGCQIMPDDIFASIGFTTDELAKFAKRETWLSAPESFIAKTDQMYAAYKANREALISGQDKTPPALSAVSAAADVSAASIQWATDEVSSSQVEWGETNKYGNLTTLDAAMVLNHTVPISGLTGGTLYHYRVRSSDRAGNLAMSSDKTFTTRSDVVVGAVQFVDGEIPVGAVDGKNVIFTLANEPNPMASLKVYRNGLRLRIDVDYVVEKNVITFLQMAIPQLEDLLLVDYRY